MWNFNEPGIHHFRLMPNKDNIKNNLISVRLLDSVSGRMSKLYFSLIMVNGVIKPAKLNGSIINISKPISELVRNSNGLVLGINTNIGSYDVDINGVIRTSPNDKAYPNTDISHIENFYPYDIKSGYTIEMVTDTIEGYTRVLSLGVKDDNPIWSEGVDKDDVIKLYDGISLEKSVNEWKNKFITDYPNILLDEQIEEYYENYRTLKNRVCDYLLGVSFKEILESYSDISDLYDGGKLTHKDFDRINDEIKNKII